MKRGRPEDAAAITPKRRRITSGSDKELSNSVAVKSAVSELIVED
jgi:hypothetical protein